VLVVNFAPAWWIGRAHGGAEGVAVPSVGARPW